MKEPRERATTATEGPLRFDGGEHWLVELRGVAAARLAGPAGRAALADFFARVVAAFELHPLGAPALHTFDGADGAPGGGGSTALLALTESHLAAHGFPEAGVLCVDLFTCRPRGLAAAGARPWATLARTAFGPCEVEARRVRRGGAAPEPCSPADSERGPDRGPGDLPGARAPRPGRPEDRP